jgi:hypothetical protein
LKPAPCRYETAEQVVEFVAERLQFKPVIEFVSCKITVERVAACAGDSNVNANAADAAVASANFALRVNFIVPP